MNLKLPHWAQIGLTVLAAVMVALAQQGQLAAWQGLFNALAGIFGSLALGTGLHSPALRPKSLPPAEEDAPTATPRTGERGVVSLGVLRALGVSCLIGFAVCCGLYKATEPAAAKLGDCVVEYSDAHPGLSLESLAIGAAWHCRADVGDVLQAIVESVDPNLAQYKAAAQAEKADPAKLGALRARARTHDAGTP